MAWVINVLISSVCLLDSSVVSLSLSSKVSIIIFHFMMTILFLLWRRMEIELSFPLVEPIDYFLIQHSDTSEYTLASMSIVELLLGFQVTRKYTKQEIQMMSSANNIAQEVLGGIRTVTAFGGQKKAEDRYMIIQKKHFNNIFFRYSIDLDKAKTVGIQKSIALGLCHSLIQVVLYMAFAITFWCKFPGFSFFVSDNAVFLGTN